MARLSRRIVRNLIRVSILFVFVGIVAFVCDIFLDFLPSTLQSRLPLHAAENLVIVDVWIEYCFLKKNCDFSSLASHNLVPKDLYLGKSWTRHAYVHYKQMLVSELQQQQEVVLSIATGRYDPNSHEAALPQVVFDDLESVVENSLILNMPKLALETATKHGWRIVDKKAGLWIKYGKYVPNHAVTSLKVLFGEDAEYPSPHWTLADQGLELGLPEYVPRIAFTIGKPKFIEPSVLRFNELGTFKIAQIADEHMSTGHGTCDHPVPPSNPDEKCLADTRTREFILDVIDKEKPDLIVFTGDQVFGMSSPDPETSLLKALAPAIEREIPFAVVWGNHDDQSTLSNEELMVIVMELPFSLGKLGPQETPGVGNYYLTVSPHSNEYPALTMYFMDSHNKLKSKDQGYDWIKPEQHDLLRSDAETIKQKLKGYSHIPLSMAFFHIPLPEYRDGWGGTLPRYGEQREAVIAPMYNSGTLEVLRALGVSVVSVGHDHVNDYCQLQPAPENEAARNSVWLCYGGGVGWGAYGGYPVDGELYNRRIRLYEINMNVPTIDTWHRVQDHDTIVNHVRLVDDGVPVSKRLDT